MPRATSAKYSCATCNTPFSRKYELSRHMRTHAENVDDLKQKCPFDGCNHKTLQRSNMKTHINAVHLKLKNEHCRFCVAAFADAAARIRHEKSLHDHHAKGASATPSHTPPTASLDSEVDTDAPITFPLSTSLEEDTDAPITSPPYTSLEEDTDAPITSPPYTSLDEDTDAPVASSPSTSLEEDTDAPVASPPYTSLEIETDAPITSPPDSPLPSIADLVPISDDFAAHSKHQKPWRQSAVNGCFILRKVTDFDWKLTA